MRERNLGEAPIQSLAVGHKTLVKYLEKQSTFVDQFKKPIFEYNEISKYDLFVILNPRSILSKREASKLEQYISRGGHVLIATEYKSMARLILDEYDSNSPKILEKKGTLKTLKHPS